MHELEEEYPHPHIEMVKDPLHPHDPAHAPIHVEAVPENLGAASSALPTSAPRRQRPSRCYIVERRVATSCKS